jgi:hypothetical protein
LLTAREHYPQGPNQCIQGAVEGVGEELAWAVLLGPAAPLDMMMAAYIGCMMGGSDNSGGRGDVPKGGGTQDYTRPLTQADLGIQGTLNSLDGIISLVDGTLIVRIDYIEGLVTNPFSIVNTLINRARSEGASLMRIEMTLGNERLLKVIEGRYGGVFQSTGSSDAIEITIQ